MNLNIVINPEIPERILKNINGRKSTTLEQMNGWYLISKKPENTSIYINVGADEFKFNTQAKIIDLFTKVTTHETLHYCIFEILNNLEFNPIEEQFVLYMAGQIDRPKTKDL